MASPRSMRDLSARLASMLDYGRRLRGHHPRTAAALATACACAAVWVTASGAWFVWSAWRDLPDSAAIGRIGDMDQATRVFDADGRPAFTLYTEQRIEVPLSAVSPALVAAVIAVEDQR